MKTSKFAKIIALISIFILTTIVWSCDDVKEYPIATDNIPPGKVTSVEVENLHGGAMITYTLPPDNDVMGVKAVYSFYEGGTEYEMFSSAFRDTIILAGYPDANEHIVNLYTLDNSRNLSEPVPVTIHPLTPPVDLIRQSLKLNETFGGVYLQWENIMEENIAISLYVDSIGEMELDDTYFSNATNGSFSFRGFPNQTLAFKVEIRDRWMNYSLPLDTVLTPLFEQQIRGRNEAGMQMWNLWGVNNQECISRGDNWATIGGSPLVNFGMLFDDILYDAGNWWHLGDDSGFLKHFIPGWPSDDNTYAWPVYMSFDMGRSAVYSRFKAFARARNPDFSAPMFMAIELWGTDNPKPLVPELTDEDRLTNLRYWTSWPEAQGTDEWKNDWSLLGDFTVSLPSGATLSSDALTAEDIQFIRNGFDFEISPDKSNIPCRYLRFIIKRSNLIGGRPGTQMGELQFFGSYTD